MLTPPSYVVCELLHTSVRAGAYLPQTNGGLRRLIFRTSRELAHTLFVISAL